jgi:hypothetical protein
MLPRISTSLCVSYSLLALPEVWSAINLPIFSYNFFTFSIKAFCFSSSVAFVEKFNIEVSEFILYTAPIFKKLTKFLKNPSFSFSAFIITFLAQI